MRKIKFIPCVFVSPFYIIFITFMVGPIAFAFYAGFTSWRLGSGLDFIGLANYIELFKDPLFRTALFNTFYFTAVFISIMMPTSFLLALALNSALLRFSNFYRTILFAPITASFIALAIVFDLMLHRDFGLVNSILRIIHLPGHIDWLRDPKFAMPSIILMRLWRSTGYYTMIMLAGLQTIPMELYDAAKVDGAGIFRRILHVTIPLMKPIFVFISVMSSIFSLQLFDEPWVLNQGGPNYATLTMTIYLYRNGFSFHKFGYASAISFILSTIMFTLSLIQLRLAREKRE
jgi:lactose/L-arabinose transport system permease protein